MGGGDRSVLLNLYRSLVRSRLDYGSIVYGSARKSCLKCLDTIHHQGLRLALGAFRGGGRVERRCWVNFSAGASY